MGHREEENQETILEDLIYDDEDIDMLDAELPDHRDDILVADGGDGAESVNATSNLAGGDRGNKAAGKRSRSKKKKNRNIKGRGAADKSLASINRFVLDTCRVLKEKKSYLVWNAVGCLGIAAMSDLVREVNAIQACGGQQTADGSRQRNGGGILWNILKTREPKSYKEIMAKGKQLEKQFWSQKVPSGCREGEIPTPRRNKTATKADPLVGGKKKEDKVHPEPDYVGERKPALERIRVPVSYEDIFEEGEIV